MAIILTPFRCLATGHWVSAGSPPQKLPTETLARVALVLVLPSRNFVYSEPRARIATGAFRAFKSLWVGVQIKVPCRCITWDHIHRVGLGAGKKGVIHSILHDRRTVRIIIRRALLEFQRFLLDVPPCTFVKEGAIALLSVVKKPATARYTG